MSDTPPSQLMRFYQKVLEIYATSVDYDPAAEASQQFFATVQNKMHWATHGRTAAELIHESEREYEKLRQRELAVPSPVEKDFEATIKQLPPSPKSKRGGKK